MHSRNTSINSKPCLHSLKLCAHATQRRYLDNVPAIVPLLEREHRVAEQRLTASKKELDLLATDKLKVCCNALFTLRPAMR